MRNDGRSNDVMRKVKIRKGYLKFAKGSCLIELGNTKVVCSASVDERVPHFLKGLGSGWVTAEYGMLPASCKERIARESSRGKVGGRTHEIQRLIGRSLRSVIDLEKLGERTVWIDCDVIQGDGGTRTASITGAFIALCDCLKNLKKDGLIKEIPIKEYIAAVSVGIIGKDMLLDLCYKEDSKADVDMNVVMTSSGKFVEVQGTAEGAVFSEQELAKLIKLAKEGIEKLIVMQKEVLGV
ncbi:MAG: ribonuclease PH [Candidatus Omnitrophota bacterium]